MLHGEVDAGDRDLVELLVRMRPVEILFEEREQLGRARHRPGRVLPSSLRHHDAHRSGATARRPRVHHVEGAHGHRHQIARHGPGLGEHQRALTGFGLLRDGRRVRQGHEAVGHVQRDLPRDLEARLVEAREPAPGRDGLELGEEVPLPLFLLGEDAFDLGAVDLAAVVDAEGAGARQEGRVRYEAHELRASRNDAQRALGAARRGPPRARDLELHGVQPDHRRGRPDLDLDGDAPLEVLALRVEPHLDRLALRADVGRKPKRGGGRVFDLRGDLKGDSSGDLRGDRTRERRKEGERRRHQGGPHRPRSRSSRRCWR
jgi:hypothetical protein